MRKVMYMNNRFVEHNGELYEVKERKWSKEKITYETMSEFKDFKDVIQNLTHNFDHIELDEEITEDEAKHLYFGFDGLKEKIDSHYKENRFKYYRLEDHELETILVNMAKFNYYKMTGHFHKKPFLGILGDRESLTINSVGSCFFKPTMMEPNSLKIDNSYFTYYGDAYVSVGFESKSLWLQIHKNSRNTIQLDFVPSNKKHSLERSKERGL